MLRFAAFGRLKLSRTVSAGSCGVAGTIVSCPWRCCWPCSDRCRPAGAATVAVLRQRPGCRRRQRRGRRKRRTPATRQRHRARAGVTRPGRRAARPGRSRTRPRVHRQRGGEVVGHARTRAAAGTRVGDDDRVVDCGSGRDGGHTVGVADGQIRVTGGGTTSSAPASKPPIAGRGRLSMSYAGAFDPAPARGAELNAGDACCRGGSLPSAQAASRPTP